MIRQTSTLLLLAAAIASPCAAQAIDPARSRITVLARQMNVPVEAPFRKFSAQVSFDPGKPEAASARIEIDLNSFDIGDPEINESVKERNWFDTKNHPTARFVSSSVRALGGRRFEARGPLTIKGKTFEVAAPFTVKAEGGARIYEGAFPIRRLQYDIGDAHWRDTSVVADEVQIRFRLHQTFAKAAPAK